MQATIDIPESWVERLQAQIGRNKPFATGVPVQMIAHSAPDGSFVFHFVSIAFSPQEPQDAVNPVKQNAGTKKKSPPRFAFAAPHIHVKPGMSHEWADIKRAAEECWAAELAEKERKLLAECK